MAFRRRGILTQDEINAILFNSSSDDSDNNSDDSNDSVQRNKKYALHCLDGWKLISMLSMNVEPENM